MRRFVVVVGLVACGGKKDPEPAAKPAPIDAAAVPTSDLCTLGRDALAIVSTCNGKNIDAEVVKMRQVYSGVASMVKGTGSAETTCAQILHKFDEELHDLGCALPLSPVAHGHMLDLVEAWYNTRTPVKPTGDAKADEVIGRIVKLRDAACACSDEPCLAAIDKQLDTIGSFAQGTSDDAIKLGEALMDDVGRCGARIRKPVKR